MVEIEIRVPRRTAVLALAAGLLCLLWRFSLSQKMDNMWTGNPTGAYSGVTVTGVTAGGTVDTLLATAAPNMVRLGSTSGTSTQAKLYSTIPLTGIGFRGGAGQLGPPVTLGGSAVTFNSRGPDSGIGFVTQSPIPGPPALPNVFRIYTWNNTLAFNYNDNADSAPKLQLDSGGFHIACRTVPAPWGTTTSCPTGLFALGDMAQSNSIAPGDMICCPIGLKQ